MQEFCSAGAPGFTAVRSEAGRVVRTLPGATRPTLPSMAAPDRRLSAAFLFPRARLPRRRAPVDMTLLAPAVPGFACRALGPRDVTLDVGMRSGEHKAAVAERGTRCGGIPQWDLVHPVVTGEAVVVRHRSCAADGRLKTPGSVAVMPLAFLGRRCEVRALVAINNSL